MSKIEIDLDDVLGGFLGIVKKRHEEGKCGCKKHEGGAHSSEEEDEEEEENETKYTKTDLETFRKMTEDVLQEDGEGFAFAYSEKANGTTLIVKNVNFMRIMSTIVRVVSTLIQDNDTLSENGKMEIRKALGKALLKF